MTIEKRFNGLRDFYLFVKVCKTYVFIVTSNASEFWVRTEIGMAINMLGFSIMWREVTDEELLKCSFRLLGCTVRFHGRSIAEPKYP